MCVTTNFWKKKYKRDCGSFHHYQSNVITFLEKMIIVRIDEVFDLFNLIADSLQYNIKSKN